MAVQQRADNGLASQPGAWRDQQVATLQRSAPTSVPTLQGVLTTRNGDMTSLFAVWAS
jgi:hypothetical protein